MAAASLSSESMAKGGQQVSQPKDIGGGQWVAGWMGRRRTRRTSSRTARTPGGARGGRAAGRPGHQIMAGRGQQMDTSGCTSIHTRDGWVDEGNGQC